MNDARLQVAFGGLHPLRVQALYAEYGPERALHRLRKGAEKTTDRIRAAVSIPAEQRRSQLRGAGVAVVFKGEADYPELLAELPDGPDLLFVRGALPGEPGVAVVGSRRCTAYGRSLAERYGKAIAASGWPLVSGLARGIDGAAHRGTVNGGGQGIAVLGSGDEHILTSLLIGSDGAQVSLAAVVPESTLILPGRSSIAVERWSANRLPARRPRRGDSRPATALSPGWRRL